MKSKYTISVISKESNEIYKSYIYSYGATKNIQFNICKGNAYIQFEQNSKRNREIISEGKDALLNDFVKKAMLIHQILFGESIKIETIKVTENEDTIYESGDTIIYSLVDKKKTEFRDEWEDLIQHILDTPVSREGEVDALIKNAVMAKSTGKECFRFMYNWMAMNGLYKRIAKVARQKYTGINNSFDNEKLYTDREQIKLLARLYFKKNTYIKNSTEKSLFNQARQVLDEVDIEESSEELCYSLLNNDDNILNIKLKGLQLGDEQGYTCAGFMLLWLPYRIRCKYFHSDITMPIYAVKNESILKELEILNKIIESFLDENIPVWCVDEIKEDYLNKLETVVRDWK